MRDSVTIKDLITQGPELSFEVAISRILTKRYLSSPADEIEIQAIMDNPTIGGYTVDFKIIEA